MSRPIWKFPLRIGQVTTVHAPPDAKVLLAAINPADGGPAIWLEVDQDIASVERLFLIIGTGRSPDPDEVHVGSMIDRDFVWHVYERRL